MGGIAAMTTQSSLTPEQIREASAMGVLWQFFLKPFSFEDGEWCSKIRTGEAVIDQLNPKPGYISFVKGFRPYRAPGHITLHNGTSERPEGLTDYTEVLCYARGMWEPCTHTVIYILDWSHVQYFIELPKVSK
jgi:hypothetical protein